MTENTTPSSTPRGRSAVPPPPPENNLTSSGAQASSSAGATNAAVTTGGSTPSPSQPSAVLPRVVKPIMGGIVHLDDGKEVAWTGGVPNVEWTGFEDPTTALESPNQLRPTGITSWPKGQAKRRAG